MITYMSYIPKKEYDKMYDMLDVEASGKIEREKFIKRNSAIYEGIEIKNLNVKITSYEKKTKKVFYNTTFDTCAGPIRFSNVAEFKKGKEGYLLVWDDSLIFPDLLSSDKVRVSTTEANRGTIYDRNGTVLAGEGYTQNSVVGRSGLESLFEKELKGENGCRIFLVDEEGQEKTELASVPVKNGKDVKLTIDAGLQTSLYQAFQKDKSCSVAMNPDTGEVLALLSTPSYDNNAFILGLSEEQWKGLNEDEEKPLYKPVSPDLVSRLFFQTGRGSNRSGIRSNRSRRK